MMAEHNTPCHCVTVDVREASNELRKKEIRPTAA